MDETLDDIARHERAPSDKPKLVVKQGCADQVAFFHLGEMIEAGSAQQMVTAPKLKQTQDHVTGRFG